jgi:hypothetical protein
VDYTQEQYDKVLKFELEHATRCLDRNPKASEFRIMAGKLPEGLTQDELTVMAHHFSHNLDSNDPDLQNLKVVRDGIFEQGMQAIALTAQAKMLDMAFGAIFGRASEPELPELKGLPRGTFRSPVKGHG